MIPISLHGSTIFVVFVSLLSWVLLSPLNGVPALFQHAWHQWLLSNWVACLLFAVFCHKGLNDEYLFSLLDYEGERLRQIRSSRHRMGSILLTARIVSRNATAPGGIDARMRKQSNRWQRPPASQCSSTSGEVGRKFRDLIQSDGRTATGKTWSGRTMRVLSRNADFLGSSVPWDVGEHWCERKHGNAEINRFPEKQFASNAIR